MSQLPAEDRRPVQRFALHARRNDPAAEQAMEQARQRIVGAGGEVVSLQQVLEGAEAGVLISFGGDGTLLHAARLMAPRGIPVLGVNYGRVGYLCSVNQRGLEDALGQLLEGSYHLDRRSMLRARVSHLGELVWQADALNEFFVGGSNRTLTLDLSLDGEPFGTIRGDGVILSTRTGSTAYAYSAGGSVLLVDALVLVASNAVFSSTIKSMVLPTETRVSLRNRTHVARPYVIADGQKDFQISQETEVEIGLSPYAATLVDLGRTSQIQALRQGFQELMLRELQG